MLFQFVEDHLIVRAYLKSYKALKTCQKEAAVTNALLHSTAVITATPPVHEEGETF